MALSPIRLVTEISTRIIWGSLKTVYAAEANEWMHNHPGLGIPQTDNCLIFRNAYEEVPT
jgi:hypothetical protein